MPIYEYRCNACGTVFARLQSISAPSEPTTCRECGSSETERLLSIFAAGSSSTQSVSFGNQASCGPSGGG